MTPILAGSPPPACLLEYDTMALADKFGNISIVCLPPNSSDDEDPTGNKALWDRGLLNGASQKAEVIMNYHIGETAVTAEDHTDTRQLRVWSTQQSVGVLVPFTSHENVIDGDLCEQFNSMDPHKQKSC